MRHAVNNNFFIAVHIHLDDGLNKGTWRNALVFNPSQKYGEVSYWEGVVRPAAEAVKDANVRKRDVYFAMQAEMGATLFYYPKNYRSMVGSIKRIISASGIEQRRAKVGVNINWEKICGCPGFLIDSTNYYNDLKNNWWRVTQAINVRDVQAMFRAVDWIGVSAYAGLPEYPSIGDLENSFRKVRQGRQRWSGATSSSGRRRRVCGGCETAAGVGQAALRLVVNTLRKGGGGKGQL
jgi:hypothetical protein